MKKMGEMIKTQQQASQSTAVCTLHQLTDRSLGLPSGVQITGYQAPLAGRPPWRNTKRRLRRIKGRPDAPTADQSDFAINGPTFQTRQTLIATGTNRGAAIRSFFAMRGIETSLAVRYLLKAMGCYKRLLNS